MKCKNGYARLVAGGCFAVYALIELYWAMNWFYYDYIFTILGCTLLAVSMFARNRVLTSIGAGLSSVGSLVVIVFFFGLEYLPTATLIRVICQNALIHICFILLMITGLTGGRTRVPAIIAACAEAAAHLISLAVIAKNGIPGTDLLGLTATFSLLTAAVMFIIAGNQLYNQKPKKRPIPVGSGE